MHAFRPVSAVALLLLLGTAASHAHARPGGWGWGSSSWGSSGWGSSGWSEPGWGRTSSAWPDQRLNSARDDREGKVDADSFMADGAADALGHGAVTVATRASDSADPDTPDDQPVYEAALIDQLVKAGYDTAAPDPAGGQRAEIRVVRDVLVPEEGKRKPVSGSMTVGAGTHGSMMGMAVAVDLSKPRKALVSTRLEVRIFDVASDKALWEGHAQIATRQDDSRWNEQAIAGRLAAALFAQFPSSSIGAGIRR